MGGSIDPPPSQLNLFYSDNGNSGTVPRVGHDSFVPNPFKIHHSWVLPSSGIWLLVVRMWTDVSEECNTFIFRATTCCTLTSCLVDIRPWRWKWCSSDEDGGDIFSRNIASHRDYSAISQKMQYNFAVSSSNHQSSSDALSSYVTQPPAQSAVK
jgi:hypothetical protein